MLRPGILGSQVSNPTNCYWFNPWKAWQENERRDKDSQDDCLSETHSACLLANTTFFSFTGNPMEHSLRNAVLTDQTMNRQLFNTRGRSILPRACSNYQGFSRASSCINGNKDLNFHLSAPSNI